MSIKSDEVAEKVSERISDESEEEQKPELVRVKHMGTGQYIGIYDRTKAEMIFRFCHVEFEEVK